MKRILSVSNRYTRQFFVLSISFIFSFLFFTGTSLFANEKKIIKIGAFNYYPAIFKDIDGKIKGFYVDALKEIEKKENIKFEYVYNTWNESIENLKKGKIDILPSLAKTPERINYFDYCNNSLLTVWGEMYVTLSSSIDGLNEINNKKIAIMKADHNGKFFSELIKKIDINCEFVEYPEFESVFQAIKNKEVDAGIVNNTYGAAKFKEFNLRSTGVVFNPFDIYFAVKKGQHKDILLLLDSYLEKWKHEKNSVYNNARQKWSHGTLGNIEVFPQWLKIILFTLGGISILFLGFIILLRKRVYLATKDILEKKEILKLSEEKFRNFVNHSPIGIFLINDIGKFIDVNPAASSITGYAREELLLMGIQDFCSPQVLYNGVPHLNELMQNGTCSSEFQFLHKNGKYKWWSVNSVTLNDKLFLCYANDIDKRKRDELLMVEQNEKIKIQNEELLKAKDRAEESDRLKTSFLQNMSHEIRTPMNAIMGFSELLPNYFHDKEKLQKFSSIIKQRGADLIEIINDILDIAKIESGQLPVHIEKCNLKVIFLEIDTFFREYKKKINKDHIKIIINVENLLIESHIKTDPVKLKQILINLIGNAFKFTNEGTIEIGCHFDKEQKLLNFYVSDTGIGIPKEKHKEIFERFRQGNEETSRIYGGTGLGLSIVKGLLNLLGGKIWLESEINKGSRFTFSIPCEIILDSPAEKPLELYFKNNKPRDAKILIVEDDFYNTEYLKEVLVEAGFSFLQTEYGEKAVEICNTEEIDVVLMDIRILGMQGYESIKCIKENNPHIPIITQTAYATTLEKEKAFAVGSDDYISKPINRNVLLNKIDQCLNKKAKQTLKRY